MAIKLNKDAVYRAAKSQDKDYKITDGGGLSLGDANQSTAYCR